MKNKLTTKTLASSALFTAALICTTAALTLGPVTTARAQEIAATCSLDTLHGSYVFATHGWNIVNGAAVPKAIVEEIDFKGDGTLASPFATVSVNGSVFHSSGAVGTYTLQPNCTGTVSFTNGPSFDIVVDPPTHGAASKQLWMIQTGPAAAPAVFEGIAVKVSR